MVSVTLASLYKIMDIYNLNFLIEVFVLDVSLLFTIIH